MFMVIIKRNKELQQFRSIKGWVWICGRRKTGKTFFVKNFTKYDEYFFVNRDQTILRNNKIISFDTFFELFKELIPNKKIVIDEFHRLPQQFFDYLHASKNGELVAISSTLWLSKKLLGKGSPLMGLFSLLIFGIADEKDVLNSLRELDKKELVEAAVYLREPILAQGYRRGMRDYLSNFLFNNRLSLTEIIREIFNEEGRQISLVYEGILRAIASGKTNSGEISSHLFSRKLIKKDNPGLIQRYLDTLVRLGIIEKIPVFNKKRFIYQHTSPLFDLHFYLDEKYNYTDNDIPLRFIRNVVNEKLPFHVERFFENLLAKGLGLRKVAINEPEIDIALTDFKKLSLIAEVKWKNKVYGKDLRNLVDKFSRFNCKKLLIVMDKALVDKDLGDIDIIDIKDISDFL